MKHKKIDIASIDAYCPDILDMPFNREFFNSTLGSGVERFKLVNALSNYILLSSIVSREPVISDAIALYNASVDSLIEFDRPHFVLSDLENSDCRLKGYNNRSFSNLKNFLYEHGLNLN